MFTKLRSPSNTTKNKNLKIAANMNSLFNTTQTQEQKFGTEMQRQMAADQGGAPLLVQQQRFKKPSTNSIHTSKATKSSEKYMASTNDSQTNNGSSIPVHPVRYESLQSKIKNKRRLQGGGGPLLQLKENVYSPTSTQQQFEQQLSQTTTSNLEDFSDRKHIDLSLTQSIDPRCFNQNQTIKSSEKMRNNNFDFNCTLKMPVSTKNASIKANHNNGSFVQNFTHNNTQLQVYINMNSTQTKPQLSNITVNDKSTAGLVGGSQKRKASQSGSKKIIGPGGLDNAKKIPTPTNKILSNIIRQKGTSFRQDKSKDQALQRQKELHQQKIINSGGGESELYKNLTQKIRKDQQNKNNPKQQSNGSFNNTFSAQQLQQQQQIQQSQCQQIQQQLQQAKLQKQQQLQQQQQQQALYQQIINNTQQLQPQNNIQLIQPQLTLQKKQSMPLQSTNHPMPFYQHQIPIKNNQNNPGFEQLHQGILVKEPINQENVNFNAYGGAQSTTNKAQKSFVFDLAAYTVNGSGNINGESGKKKQKHMLYDTNIMNNGKKFLNMTGTLPKGLLSPTNNEKHKHAGYFESASTIAQAAAAANMVCGPQSTKNNNNSHYNNTMKQSYEKAMPSGSSFNNNKNNGQRNVNHANVGQFNPSQLLLKQNYLPVKDRNNYHSMLQVVEPHITQKEENGSHSVKNGQKYNSKTQIVKQNMNQTTKIQRLDSMSSGDGSHMDHHTQDKKDNTDFVSTVKKTHQAGLMPAQTRKTSHQKNSTLPNAAVLLLNEIIQRGSQNNQGNSNGSGKQGFQIKPSSEKQSPRNVSKDNTTNNPIFTKKFDLDEITTQKKKRGQSFLNNTGLVGNSSNYKQKNCNIDIKSDNDDKNSTAMVLSGGDCDEMNLENIEIELEQDMKQLKMQSKKVNNFLMERQKDKVESIKKSFQLTATNSKDLSAKLKEAKKNIRLPVSLSPRSNNSDNQNNQKFNENNAMKQQQQQNAKAVVKQPVEVKTEDLTFPMSTAKALKHFINYLTDHEKGEILDYKQVYFLGIHANKIKGSPQQPYNYGYDDERGDFNVVLKDHIGYRFEVLDFLGKGSFGQALKCHDHKTGEIVAIKLIRNKKRFQHQAGVELKLLQHLTQNDPDDAHNIIRIKDYIVFRKHLVISCELFSINLYEFIKNSNFQGVSLSLIRRFAIQMLQALKFLKEQHVIHCDLKPENILLKSPDKSGIKIIDFGSSCFQHERIYTYIQSRFYRAPEIILGIPYTMGIDMWSFGCILAELYTGFPIFPGENEQEQLALIMEVKGIPPQHILNQSTRKKIFFDPQTDQPLPVQNSRGKIRIPNSKQLINVLGCQHENFIDFLERCLDWDPQTRITPFEALLHDWVIEGLPPKVLLHHKRMLGIEEPDSESSGTFESQSTINKAPLVIPVQNVATRKPQQQRSMPPASKVKQQMNNTCLLQNALNQTDLRQKVKSLNKTGLIVLKDNESMVDGLCDDPPIFFDNENQLLSGNNILNNKHSEKSKTANLADMLHEINKKQNKKEIFESSHNNAQLKRNSFFSQNNLNEIFYCNDGEDEEGEIIDGQLLPFDERSQCQNDEQQESFSKKSKLPFSFLMHHYMKTTGEQQHVQGPTQAQSFYKPQKDIKLNNFVGLGSNMAQQQNIYQGNSKQEGGSSGNNSHQKKQSNKQFINMSSNI